MTPPLPAPALQLGDPRLQGLSSSEHFFKRRHRGSPTGSWRTPGGPLPECYFYAIAAVKEVDHGVQETLLGFLTGARPGQEKMARAPAALAAARPPYELAAYEGGPSGYALPGRDSPPQREANERYGKSLAMAVAALDAWLGSYALGWTGRRWRCATATPRAIW
ncbi:MAG: hypothetical protein HYU66_25235 [Armatimonadetes bacterium]|nr:hypothetical protein [Armatimonadota bacterium]